MSTRLAFSTPKSFNPVSWLVKKLTGSHVSHVVFVYADADFGMDMVMEAHELGFRLITLEHFARHNNVVRIVEPRASLNPGLRWAATWLGTSYDFGGLLGMAWVLLMRKLGRRARNPLQSSRAMFCSEIAVRALQESGCAWARELTASTVSPQMLLDRLLEGEHSKEA